MTLEHYYITTLIAIFLLIMNIFIIGKTPECPPYKPSEMTVGELLAFIGITTIPIINVIMICVMVAAIIVSSVQLLRLNFSKFMNKKLFK